MEKKDIIFEGVSNIPNDELSKDGQLSLSVNAIKHGGSIQPVEEGSPVLDDKGREIVIARNERLAYIHHLPDTGEERYIVLHSDILVSSILLDEEELLMSVGETHELTPSIEPSDATNQKLIWTTSDAGIATVDENGVITAVSQGECVITCKAADESKIEAVCRITVVQLVESLVVSNGEVTLVEGGAYPLEATIMPSNATNKGLSWVSDDESVATISQDGEITAVAVGTATITCSTTDGSGLTATCIVHVVSLSTRVIVTPSSIVMNAGASSDLTATVTTNADTTPSVTWQTTNSSVATVDQEGRVTAVGSGQCDIIATADDGSGAQGYCHVRVLQPVTDITLSDYTLDMIVGETYTLRATIEPSDADNTTLTWESSDPTIATVDANGKVTAIEEGECTITATATDGSNKTRSCQVSVAYEAFVDLELPSGTLWATRNIGSDTSYDKGDYFAWGETEENEDGYGWQYYKYANGTANSITKYNVQDGKLELEAEDDAATATLGNTWQMPSRSQMWELTSGDYTTIKWTTRKGVSGHLITSKANGKSIFLPAAGLINGHITQGEGEYGKYWTRTLGDSIKNARSLEIWANAIKGGVPEKPRYEGYTIRPIFVGSPSPRPRRRGSKVANLTFTLMDEADRVEMIGKLEEGRTMSIELLYCDNATKEYMSEVVSIRFTKENMYVLPTHIKTPERNLEGAEVVGYDDDSVTLNITFHIDLIARIVEVEEQEYTPEPTEEVPYPEPTTIDVYYYGSMGSYTNIPKEVYDQAVEEHTTEFEESIVANEDSLKISWFNTADTTRKLICEINTSVREITSVKNVLIISTNAGLYFARNIGQTYQYFGALPELPCVTPYLTSVVKRQEHFPNENLSQDYFITEGTAFKEKEKYFPEGEPLATIYRILFAHIDNILEKAHENGHFVLPFQVRIAYRMFDGDYITVSRPYPLCPTTTYMPFILVKRMQDNDQRFLFNAIVAESELHLKFDGVIDEAWRDIITGFDIFISQEVGDYTKDDSGKTIDWIYVGDDFKDNTEINKYIPSYIAVVNNSPVLRRSLYEEPQEEEGEGEQEQDDRIVYTDMTLSTGQTYTISESEYNWNENQDFTFFIFSDAEYSKVSFIGSEENYIPYVSEQAAIERYLINDKVKEKIISDGYKLIDTKRTYAWHNKVTYLRSFTANSDCVFKKCVVKTRKVLKPIIWQDRAITGVRGTTEGFSRPDIGSMNYKGYYMEFAVAYGNTPGGNYPIGMMHFEANEEYEEAHPNDLPILLVTDRFYQYIKEYFDVPSLDAYEIIPQFIERAEYSTMAAGVVWGEEKNVAIYRVGFSYDFGDGTEPSHSVKQPLDAGIMKTHITTQASVGSIFRNQESFYKIDSVNFSDMSKFQNGVYTPIFHKTDIKYLSAKPQLDNKVINRYPFNCNDIYAYNNRLNVVVDSQELEIPDYADNLYMGVNESVTRREEVIHYAVEVVKEGITRIVPVPKTGDCKTHADALRYFFYPNQNATRLLEYIEDGETYEENFRIELESITTAENLTQTSMDNEPIVLVSRCKLKKQAIRSYSLTKHEGIYGAYTFNDWELLEPYDTKEKVVGLEIGKAAYADGTETPEFDAATNRAIYEAIVEEIKQAPQFSMIDTENLPFTDEEIESGDAMTATIEAGTDIDGFNETARRIQKGYQKKFHVGNKILQSDIENPFAFLNRNVVQLGCETIHRVCAASRPISEGQKGKHPLYAFTDEGIYAIAVNEEGEYEKADLVSPEVMTGTDVHQVEQSVLFSSSKGLMELTENDLACMSSDIEGHNHAEGLIALEKVKEAAGLKYVGTLGFHAKDWFTGAELVYDPKHELIYIFRESFGKGNGDIAINLGLVYDVKEGVWGMYENKLLYGVNSYTDAIAVEMIEDASGKLNGRGRVVNMSEPKDRHTQTYHSLLVTRPMHFGEGDTYKTMEDIILRGAQGTDKGKLVVWASNDLEHWKVIGSSTGYKWRNYSGTPYKYFRLGILMDEWQEGDSITGASIDITTRLTNKLR